MIRNPWGLESRRPRTTREKGQDLHFGAFRTTNVTDPSARGKEAPLEFKSTDALKLKSQRREIDPYGWYASEGVEPRVWYGFSASPSAGGFSINLWEPNEAPPYEKWGDEVEMACSRFGNQWAGKPCYCDNPNAPNYYQNWGYFKSKSGGLTYVCAPWSTLTQ